MRRFGLFAIALSFCTLCTLTLAARENKAVVMEKTPVYRVTVVARSVQSVNYRHLAGSTRIDFRGTSAMPGASGHAKIASKVGRIEIQADFKDVPYANVFGPEYLTYVLWAVTPEGRPINLGEVIPERSHDVRIRVTANLQAFGMIVTAEPYFAVTRPSNVTVLENAIRRDTKGWEQPVSTRYEATEKGEYTVDLAGTRLPASLLTPEESVSIPLSLLEARNAVTIAQATGAQQYAPDMMARAQESLDRAEDSYRRNRSLTAIGMAARGAAQAAEDARVVTIRVKEDERIAAEQKAADDRAEQARLQAEFEQRQAESARAQAMSAQQAEQQAELTAQQAQQEREAAERSAQQAQQEREAAEQAKAEALEAQQQAEAARQEALDQQQALSAQTQAAQQQAESAEQRAMAAEQEKDKLRQKLMAQLNEVLQTRDTARGLIVNINDVLFDVDKATLKPGARVRLAKVAGILQSYPELKLQLEGYTDSTGTLQHNQTLSERRAAAVREFLIAQGVPPGSITAQGFGPSNPVATNETREGRQMNRRVDMVVNGESIAAHGGPSPSLDQNAPASMSQPEASQPEAPATSEPAPPDKPEKGVKQH
jgi:outer membrane protein OmpA-like peptidoglycan-associated protein